MTLRAKILIVGGGAMGTCLALHAARRCDPLREPVVLIEKERLGAGSSGHTAAILHQGYSDRTMAGMAREAVKIYSRMKSSTGRSVGYRRTGVLVLAGADSEAVAQLERDVEMQRELAIDVERVEAGAIRGLVQGIEVDDRAVGAWQPAGGFVDPARAIEAFATLARDKGTVTRIGVKDPKILVEQGRAAGVETSAGTFLAPHVVLATGPWTPSILEGLGVGLPLKVVRIQECAMRMPDPPEVLEDEDDEGQDPGQSEFETRFMPDPLDHMPVAHPVVIDLENDFYARCEPREGRTRFGRNGLDGLQELASPEALTDEVDPEFTGQMRRCVSERLPVYRDTEDLGSRAAWITTTPDRRPIVGPVEEIPGLYVVAGFTGNDFQLAPSIGEGLAQMIVGQPVSAFDPEFFSLARFSSR